MAGRAQRTVRNRHAVTSPETGKIMALHATGKALADGGADNIDKLASGEMIGLKFLADIDKCIFTDSEFDDRALWLDPRFGEMTAHGAADILDLALPAPSCSAV